MGLLGFWVLEVWIWCEMIESQHQERFHLHIPLDILLDHGSDVYWFRFILSILQLILLASYIFIHLL